MTTESKSVVPIVYVMCVMRSDNITKQLKTTKTYLIASTIRVHGFEFQAWKWLSQREIDANITIIR